MTGTKTRPGSASAPSSCVWGVETPAWWMLLRGWLCGSELVLVCFTLTHQRLLNKPSVHLSSGFLHSSIHQILMGSQVGARSYYCSKCLGSVSEDLGFLEVGLENSKEEGPPIASMFLEIHEATQGHRKPSLNHPSQAHRGLQTSCSFTWD